MLFVKRLKEKRPDAFIGKARLEFYTAAVNHLFLISRGCGSPTFVQKYPDPDIDTD